MMRDTNVSVAFSHLQVTSCLPRLYEGNHLMESKTSLDTITQTSTTLTFICSHKLYVKQAHLRCNRYSANSLSVNFPSLSFLSLQRLNTDQRRPIYLAEPTNRYSSFFIHHSRSVKMIEPTRTLYPKYR